MLLRDFFPRLRERAMQRYGQVVTERQFTGWRESGLLPGPAPPIGLGRGRSPERHWPFASYRRALRICRYKSWGAHRKSQWWIALWLSGEAVAADTIRKSIKRECSIDRRTYRNISDSDRWRNSNFTSFNDIMPNSRSDKEAVVRILKFFNISPDQYRRLAMLEVGKSKRGDHIDLIKEVFPSILGTSPELAQRVLGDITPISFNRVRRSSRVSAANADLQRHYADGLSELEIDTTRKLFWLSLYENYLCMLLLLRMGEMPFERVAFFALPIVWHSPRHLQFRTQKVLQIAFELDADRREDIMSGWRLNGANKRVKRLQRLLTCQAKLNRFGNGISV